jgi:hypothetical protein
MRKLPPHLPDPRQHSCPDHRPGHQSARLIALPEKTSNHANFAH